MRIYIRLKIWHKGLPPSRAPSGVKLSIHLPQYNPTDFVRDVAEQLGKTRLELLQRAQFKNVGMPVASPTPTQLGTGAPKCALSSYNPRNQK